MNVRSYSACSSARGVSLRPRDETAERRVSGGCVREQHQLVRRVEPHQLAHGPPRREQRAEPAVREHALHEVLAQPGIAQPPLFFDGQRRHPRTQGRGIEPRAGALGHRARRVHLHPLHPAARRIPLQHVPGEIERRKLRDPRLRVGHHAVGPVRAALRCDHPHRGTRSRLRRSRQVAHQVHGLARRAHADLHLGAHRHPLHVPAERVGQEAVAFVPAVEAHLLSEQARRDPDADGSGGSDEGTDTERS